MVTMDAKTITKQNNLVRGCGTSGWRLLNQLVLLWRTMRRQTILQKSSKLQQGKAKNRRRAKQTKKQTNKMEARRDRNAHSWTRKEKLFVGYLWQRIPQSRKKRRCLHRTGRHSQYSLKISTSYSHHFFIFRRIFNRQFLYDAVEIALFIPSIASSHPFLVFSAHHSRLQTFQKLLIPNLLCCKHTSHSFCPCMCFARIAT